MVAIDTTAARALLAALRDGAEGLRTDRLAVDGLTTRAAALGVGSDGGVDSLDAARRVLEELAVDLGRRLAALDTAALRVRRIDDLDRRLRHLPRAHPDRAELTAVRDALLEDLVEGDHDVATRLRRVLDAGVGLGTAIGTVLGDLRREARVRAAQEELGLGPGAAAAFVAAFDADVARIVRAGTDEATAIAVVAQVRGFALDIDVIVARMESTGRSAELVVGEALAARSLGLQPDELAALGDLRTHFAAFDRVGAIRAESPFARRPDGRVAVDDLRHVVDHPSGYTPAQVTAAAAILAQPGVLARLDTARENDDLFGEGADAAPVGFGSLESGDGVVSEDDLAAFFVKSGLAVALGPYAAEIDVAADPAGRPDGIRSRRDLEAFLTRPDLPEPVVQAARRMIDLGVYDESWWAAHRDEFAMAAALLASGAMVVATAGTGAVVLAGVGAAAGTTLVVNATTDADLLDGVVVNGLTGGVIAAGVAGLAGGVTGYGASVSALSRAAAVVDIASGSATVVSSGGLDLVLPADAEDDVHDVADPLSEVLTVVSAGATSATRLATGEVGDRTVEAGIAMHAAADRLDD